MAMTVEKHIDEDAALPLTSPRHGIPNIDRTPRDAGDRGAWSRIFGLIHKLSAEEDDGPVSRIRY